jgi:hypothetical protein
MLTAPCPHPPAKKTLNPNVATLTFATSASCVWQVEREACRVLTNAGSTERPDVRALLLRTLLKSLVNC